MRIWGSALLASVLVVGCTHSPVAQDDFKPVNDVIYLKPTDRNPAAAPDLRWVPGEITLQATSGGGQITKTAQVEQVMSWTETETFTDTRMEYQEVRIDGNCSDFQCSSGTGKSALWDAYFSAPGEKKAAALNAAIQGIGVESAKALVAKGYFKSKPNSWTEFAKVIEKAADADVIKRSVATSVLTRYRYENIGNLGYDRGSCQETVRQCSLYVSRLEPVKFTNTREVKKYRVIQAKSFDVKITVKGSVLLPSERDVLTIKVDEEGKVVDVDVDGYNRYSVVYQRGAGQAVDVQLTADSRILRDLPGNIVRQDAYQLIGSQANFILDVDTQYIPGSEDPQAQLVVDYMVHTCEYGWTGLCFGSWKNAKMGSVQIRSGRTIIPVDVPRKNKSEIAYTVSRKNSRYFNDQPTSSRVTQNVKMSR